MDNLYAREFTPLDQHKINSLYKTIKGVERTDKQYRWEWIETWDGPGSSWLILDRLKPEDDNVVGQYSLIPTPLSFYGEEVKAGKTENCMSHPDLRGKRVYFPHEKKFFALAKNRFKAFFTTTGRGAPGRIRTKLGYHSLDFWTRYYYFHSERDCIDYHKANAAVDTQNSGWIMSTIVLLAKIVKARLEFTRMRKLQFELPKDLHYVVKESGKAPLIDLEEFWETTKVDYPITIHRTKEYYKWRVDENPYNEHKYVLLYQGDNLVGYAIYFINDHQLCDILDIVARGMQVSLLRSVVSAMIKESLNMNAVGIICRTLTDNRLLKETFDKFGTPKKISKSWIEKQERKNLEVRDFFGFVDKEVDESQRCADPKNWYVTALFLEK